MCKQYRNRLFLAALPFLLAGLVTGCSRHSDNDIAGGAQQVGAYNVAVLVADEAAFVNRSQAGRKNNAGKMVRESGAEPVPADGKNINRHIAVFVKKNGKIAKNAQVRISYKKAGASRMTQLPVALMKVAGEGEKTTHYGNNAHLDSGQYNFRVTINRKKTAKIKLSIH